MMSHNDGFLKKIFACFKSRFFNAISFQMFSFQQEKDRLLKFQAVTLEALIIFSIYHKFMFLWIVWHFIVFKRVLCQRDWKNLFFCIFEDFRSKT